MAFTESNALEGLHVLEVSAAGNWAASLLGMLLADQGASVAKVGVHSEHAPIEDAAARARSREARSRPGIDRNKRVLEPLATAADVAQFVACADVVILSYDTGFSELDPATIRARHPSILVVTMCEFDALEKHPPDDGRCGAATGLFTDMNLYDRLFEPGKTKYSATPLPSAYAAMHAASATCLALGRRASTGRGDHIRVSLAGAFFQAQTAHLVNGFPGNKPVPAWLRWIPQLFFRDWLEQMIADKRLDWFNRTYDCADGPKKLVVICSSRKHQPAFLRVMGLWDEAVRVAGIKDSDFDRSGSLGIRQNRKLAALLVEAFTKQSSEYWVERLAPVVPATVFRTTEEWLEQPFVREMGLRADFDDPLVGAIATFGRSVTTRVGPSQGADPSFRPRTIVSAPALLLEAWNQEPGFELEGPTPGGDPGGFASGLRVLEFTTVVAAPYCGLTLAQHGAQVTRVCAPEPYHEKFIEVSVAADVQRGKENIALDLKSDAGQQRLRQLIAEADIVIRNMRPEAAKRLGVDADSVHAICPEAIYCTISAYPRTEWPGYDPLLQIGTGIVEAYAEDSRSGFRNWLGVAGSVDYGSGASGLFAISLGLLERARGQSELRVATSLAQYAQFVQPDRIVTGPGLPPIPASPMPLKQSDNGEWQYTNPDPQGGCESAPVALTTLRSLRSQATPVTDAQVGRPCPADLGVVSVIAQKQADGSTNHFPAPSHVRFDESKNPLIVAAAVLEGPE
ncbi:MAG: CoA transferase [Myxococcota bacterium]|nr:CoA transferase [Myxococcota bacterium]